VIVVVISHRRSKRNQVMCDVMRVCVCVCVSSFPSDNIFIKQLGCLGSPDRFSHYREPKFVSLKLHWFWLWNWIYRVYLPPSFPGNVLLLEDDAVVRILARNSNSYVIFNFQCFADSVESVLQKHQKGLFNARASMSTVPRGIDDAPRE
jgi:hypothetical protein